MTGYLGSFLPGKPPLLSFPDPSDNAVLDDFLIALSQEAPAIIFVNNNLWNAFASRRNLVCEEILKPGTNLNNFYKLYLEIKENIEKGWSEFKERPTFTLEPEKIYYGKLGSSINEFYSRSSIEEKYSDKERTILSAALAFFIGFNPEKWNIFRNHDIHLLIPKSYNIKLDATETALHPKNFRQTLSLQAIKLGLKTDKMTIIQFGNPYNLTLSKFSSKTDETLKNIFSNVFISKNDLKIPSSKKNVALLPSWSIYLDGHGSYTAGIIAGFSIEVFRKFLISLEMINTNFFIYQTCYTGDKHLELPYQSLGLPIIFPFTIIAGGISANASKLVGALTPFPITNPIINIEVTKKKDLRYKITPYLDFKKFFKTLTLMTRPLTVLTNYVLTWKEALENVPNIRLAGTDHFTAINSPELIHLTKVRASIAVAENQPIIVKPRKRKFSPIPEPIIPKAILLYTPYIPAIIENSTGANKVSTFYTYGSRSNRILFGRHKCPFTYFGRNYIKLF